VAIHSFVLDKNARSGKSLTSPFQGGPRLGRAIVWGEAKKRVEQKELLKVASLTSRNRKV